MMLDSILEIHRGDENSVVRGSNMLLFQSANGMPSLTSPEIEQCVGSKSYNFRHQLVQSIPSMLAGNASGTVQNSETKNAVLLFSDVTDVFSLSSIFPTKNVAWIWSFGPWSPIYEVSQVFHQIDDPLLLCKKVNE
jgi:hypothetical protein